MEAIGEGGLPQGFPIVRGVLNRNPANVVAVAAGGPVVVITANVEPAGRAEGGDVTLLALFCAEVNGAAGGAQEAAFSLEANFGAGFVVQQTQSIERVLAGTFIHDAVCLVALLTVPRGLIAGGNGVVVQCTLTATAQNQQVDAQEGALLLLELSGPIPGI